MNENTMAKGPTVEERLPDSFWDAAMWALCRAREWKAEDSAPEPVQEKSTFAPVARKSDRWPCHVGDALLRTKDGSPVARVRLYVTNLDKIQTRIIKHF